MKTSKQTRSDINENQRLDVWLWASRFYKTRKIAADALKGGHISVNNQRGKPAKTVKVGDELRIKRFPVEFTVTISNLSDKRLSASLAAGLYVESELSQTARQEKLQLLNDQRQGLRYDHKRPGKRDRQKMLSVKNQIPDFD